MLLVFLLTTALGVVLALTLKTQYQAHASLLVRLGQEYVYDPRVGDAARGAVPDTGQVIQSETEILQSSVLKEKVLADTHECEELVSKYNSDPNSKYRIEATQDMVSRASSRADFSRSLQRDSLTALKNSQQEKRTKNLINGSLLAVGAAGAMFLSPGLGRTLTLIAGVGGLTGTILTNRADSFINQEIDRWDTYHQRTLKEGAEAEHLAESTMAWHRFLTPPD